MYTLILFKTIYSLLLGYIWHYCKIVQLRKRFSLINIRIFEIRKISFLKGRVQKHSENHKVPSQLKYDYSNLCSSPSDIVFPSFKFDLFRLREMNVVFDLPSELILSPIVTAFYIYGKCIANLHLYFHYLRYKGF